LKRISALDQALRSLQSEYVDLCDDIQLARNALQARATHDRQADRNLILFALEDGLQLIKEIIEATGLSEWTGRSELRLLDEQKHVQKYKEILGERGPRDLFRLAVSGLTPAKRS
jgi:hypothetical protein